jgi:hypothetical protein
MARTSRSAERIGDATCGAIVIGGEGNADVLSRIELLGPYAFRSG